jgi:hypothetical protein
MRSKGKRIMRERINPTKTDHSKSTPFWHDLQSCAMCLKIFLPQAYDQKIRDRAAARERGEILLAKDHVKPRGKGMPFSQKS